MEEEIGREPGVSIKDIDKIQEICASLVAHVTHKRPGIGQEELDWLKTERNDYRTLRSFYHKQRLGERIPKKKISILEKRGFSMDEISEDETFVASELLDALYFTFDYIDRTDPKKAREKESTQDFKYVTVATKANIEFADFFIKLHQRFNLKDENLYGLFDLLFEKAGITRELEAKGLDHFPGGVLAVLRAYLHLNSQLPNWQLKVPRVELDRDHAVDLVAELKKGEEIVETRYFEIKGRRETKDVEVAEITEEEKKDEVRKKIVLKTKNVEDLQILERSLYKLYEFTRLQIQRGNKAKAFWVEVPSTA